MDKLSIHGLVLWLKVGCTEAERSFPQKISIDVEMGLDLREAGKKDNVGRTADYASAARRLREKLTAKKYKLIEAVAEDAAEAVLKDKKIERVAVRVEKYALEGIRSASVEITRGI